MDKNHVPRPCQHCRWREGKEEEGDQEGPEGEIDGQQGRTMELLQMSFWFENSLMCNFETWSGAIPILRKHLKRFEYPTIL